MSIIRRHGVEPEALVSRLATRMRDHELREERLKKRFELPPFLKHFATNLNQLARQDKLPPVFGRDNEMQQVLEILCHRERANSVMLLGEPGVGKTAIVEGLARRIEFEPETVPVRLRDCQIVNLQMNTMVAGTMLRGMFEDRIQNVIREIKERPNLILFIDEAHTMVGAGSALGAPSDAANVFKSVLARGEVRIIGATTLSEYKEYIQEDEALARRFRTVHVAEPTIEETRHILYSLRPRLERNYSVRIQDEAIETALEMSPRYMRHLQLPDKVIGWLDTAAVRAEIDRRWEVDAADVVNVISNVARIPGGHGVPRRDGSLPRHRSAARHARRRPARRDRRGRPPARPEQGAAQGRLRSARRRAAVPRPDRRRQDGARQVGGGVPVRRREEDDPRRHVRVPGRRGRGRQADRHAARHRRIERGGVLTNQLKDNPYSVVLLDEVEKASPSMLNLFLQAFDEGWLTDGRGKRVYLSDAIVIMTSNIGSEYFRKLTSPLGFYSKQVGSRAGAGRDHARARTALLAGVPQPHRRGRALPPLTKDEVRADRAAADRRRSTGRWRRPADR